MTDEDKTEFISRLRKIAENEKLLESQRVDAIRGIGEINTKEAAMTLLDLAESKILLASSQSLAISLAKQILRNL